MGQCQSPARGSAGLPAWGSASVTGPSAQGHRQLHTPQHSFRGDQWCQGVKRGAVPGPGPRQLRAGAVFSCGWRRGLAAARPPSPASRAAFLPSQPASPEVTSTLQSRDLLGEPAPRGRLTAPGPSGLTGCSAWSRPGPEQPSCVPSHPRWDPMGQGKQQPSHRDMQLTRAASR